MGKHHIKNQLFDEDDLYYDYDYKDETEDMIFAKTVIPVATKPNHRNDGVPVIRKSGNIDACKGKCKSNDPVIDNSSQKEKRKVTEDPKHVSQKKELFEESCISKDLENISILSNHNKKDECNDFSDTYSSLRDYHDTEREDIPGNDLNEERNINMIILGTVDSGKSTLAGYLLCNMNDMEAQQIFHENVKETFLIGKNELENPNRKGNLEISELTSCPTPYKFAWLLDKGEDERQRGITVDVSVGKIMTKGKAIYMLDSPGHDDYIPKMISALLIADLALLVIDASKYSDVFQDDSKQGDKIGELIWHERTEKCYNYLSNIMGSRNNDYRKYEAEMISLSSIKAKWNNEVNLTKGKQFLMDISHRILMLLAVGICRVIVSINKLDTVNFDQSCFVNLVSCLNTLFNSAEKMLQKQFLSVKYVPISAFHGINVCRKVVTTASTQEDVINSIIDNENRNSTWDLKWLIDHKNLSDIIDESIVIETRFFDAATTSTSVTITSKSRNNEFHKFGYGKEKLLEGNFCNYRQNSEDEENFQGCVTDVFGPTKRTIRISLLVTSGKLQLGQKVIVLPGEKKFVCCRSTARRQNDDGDQTASGGNKGCCSWSVGDYIDNLALECDAEDPEAVMIIGIGSVLCSCSGRWKKNLRVGRIVCCVVDVIGKNAVLVVGMQLMLFVHAAVRPVVLHSMLHHLLISHHGGGMLSKNMLKYHQSEQQTQVLRSGDRALIKLLVAEGSEPLCWESLGEATAEFTLFHFWPYRRHSSALARVALRYKNEVVAAGFASDSYYGVADRCSSSNNSGNCEALLLQC